MKQFDRHKYDWSALETTHTLKCVSANTNTTIPLLYIAVASHDWQSIYQYPYSNPHLIRTFRIYLSPLIVYVYLALINISIWPHVFAKSMLFILLPISTILVALEFWDLRGRGGRDGGGATDKERVNMCVSTSQRKEDGREGKRAKEKKRGWNRIAIFDLTNLGSRVHSKTFSHILWKVAHEAIPILILSSAPNKWDGKYASK